jgi:putative glutathione S-transferase
VLVRHDYPYLHKWLQRLYWNNPAFKDTTDFQRKFLCRFHPWRSTFLDLLSLSSSPSPKHLSATPSLFQRIVGFVLFFILCLYHTDIKEHYFYSHAHINPNRIVPYGPNVDIEPLEKK